MAQESPRPQAAQRILDVRRALEDLASALEAFSRAERDRIGHAFDRFGETVESLKRRADQGQQHR